MIIKRIETRPEYGGCEVSILFIFNIPGDPFNTEFQVGAKFDSGLDAIATAERLEELARIIRSKTRGQD